MQRDDDFATRRAHLAGLSDDELQTRFWALLDEVVAPLVDEARHHTTPSIERSVLLRMGLSSLEASALVDRLHGEGLLGRGAGRIVVETAEREGVDLRTAGTGLAQARYEWERP